MSRRRFGRDWTVEEGPDHRVRMSLSFTKDEANLINVAAGDTSPASFVRDWALRGSRHVTQEPATTPTDEIRRQQERIRAQLADAAAKLAKLEAMTG